MKHARVYLGIALALIGILMVPVSFTFGEQKLSDAQKKAIADCKTKQTACVAGCSLQYGARDGSNRLQRIDCDAKCKETYLTCVFSVRRSSAATSEPGQASPPQVAPPTPTPRKISPQKVGSITGDRVAATASPAKSKSSPTPTVSKKQ